MDLLEQQNNLGCQEYTIYIMIFFFGQVKLGKELKTWALDSDCLSLNSVRLLLRYVISGKLQVVIDCYSNQDNKSALL